MVCPRHPTPAAQLLDLLAPGSNPTLSAKTARNTLKIKESEEVSYKAYLIGHVDQRRHVANTKRRPRQAPWL
jgi:hypothetical protein